MHLSGQISDWSISDLLQIMQVTKKTGSLDINGDRKGRIHFRDGNVTGAELTGVKGRYVGDDRGAIADVLYVLSTVEKGSFQVGPADGPETQGWKVEDIMADVNALESLEGEVVDAGLFEASGVRLVKEIPEPITIEPEDWQIFVSLVRPFTFNSLETAMGRGGAVRVFHTLHRLGLAEAVLDEEEADWLDRLAEDIAPGSSEPTWLEQEPIGERTPGQERTSVEEEASIEETEAVVDSLEDLVDPVIARAATENIRGVSAPASTTLTDGVYDEIRRLRSKVADAR